MRATRLAIVVVLLCVVGGGAAGAEASGWRLQPTPNPAGATTSTLSGVSCPGPNSCTAVGGAAGAGTSATLAERWNGMTWELQRTPNPAGATSSLLNDVSCATVATCYAVGSYQFGTAAPVTLIERWRGGRWEMQATPNVPGALNGVSCTSVRACTAVGYMGSGGAQATLAERWDGTAWRVQSTPDPSMFGDNVLAGVSCSAASSCMAVGGIGETIAESWNGTAWTVQPTIDSTSVSSLAAVSCTNPTSCTSVGSAFAGPDLISVGERSDGVAWTLQTTVDIPDPLRPALSTPLTGVACPELRWCLAVGLYARESAARPASELWNGSAWTVNLPVVAPSTSQSWLNAVSCTAEDICTGVGEQDSGTLAERLSS